MTLLDEMLQPFLHNLNNVSFGDFSKQLLLTVIQLILLLLGELPSFGDSFQVDGLQMFPRRDSSAHPGSLLYQGLDYTLWVFLMVRLS